MKYLIVIFSFLYFSNNLNESLVDSTFKPNVDQISLKEQFYNKLEVKINLPMMLNKYIDKKALERTEVPNSIWQDIKNNIDYTYFKFQVLNNIDYYYSEVELQSLINSNVNNPKIPITKIAFRKELGHMIEDFIEVKFLDKVNSTLLQNGFTKIN
ncbi:hypothetical protein M601_019185 [Cellulophaga baltica 4]|nr:hypothetical protein M601_019185 [Cellulophaga baltica 4]